MTALPAGTARIGPNAVLQLLPVLEAEGGQPLVDRMLAAAGLSAPPSDAGMMDERPAAAMHQALRRELPDRAPDLARAAGLATGDYILAHRIPKPAQTLLRRLPVPIAAWMLTRAIAQHSWTFAGSGRFEILSTRPLRIAIHDNPVVRGEHSPTPLCHWHCAVFERLFTTLIHPAYRATETTCCATGAEACVFEIARG
ncbi:MAG: bacteriochlorophyll 4-vinyl reductase [Alkalilacustris sp.]